MKTFTLEELNDTVQMLPFFGETLFEIHNKKNGEKEIHILDEEQERFIDTFGDIVEGEYRKTVKMATLYTDSNGVISFIEHPYQTITKANLKHIRFLLSLIGSKIIFS